MIKILDSLSELKFPVATLKKVEDISDDRTFIYYNGQALLKRKDLFETFNINEAFIPKTYAYFYGPEALLKDPNLTVGKLIIDSNLNIFLPIKRIKILNKTGTFISRGSGYIKTAEFPYKIPEVIIKNGYNPILAIIEDAAFLIGWTNKKVKEYETFI